MGPTAEAWLQRTSLFSMTRLGTDSAQASSESLTLRLVWKALVPLASLPTRIRPVYTERDRPPTAPLNRRLLVQSGATWSCEVRKSRVCSPSPQKRSEEHTSELQSRGHLVC